MNFVQKIASHLTLADDLSPDSRDREFKGRIKQCFSAFGYKPVPAVLASLVEAIFVVPFLVFFVFLLNKDIAKIVDGVEIYKDMGLLIGATDASVINNSIAAIYSLKQQYVLCYLLPCILVASVGMAGVYNVMRNVLWNTNPKFFRDFFIGIKRHFYKYVISWLILGVFALGFVYSLLEIMKCNEIGVAANGGYWALMIISGILGLILCMYYLVLQPMFVTHKYDKNVVANIKITMKNSGILALLSPLQIIFIIIILVAPCLLVLTKFGSIFLVLMASGGLSFYVLVSIQYEGFLSDNFIYYLYNIERKKAQRAQQKTEKKAKEKKKKK